MDVLENCLEIDRANCAARDIRRRKKRREYRAIGIIFIIDRAQSNLSRLKRENDNVIYSTRGFISENPCRARRAHIFQAKIKKFEEGREKEI